MVGRRGPAADGVQPVQLERERAEPTPTAGLPAVTAPATPVQSTPPIAAVSFSCRLPVVASTPGPTGMNFQGGFIQFPAAQLTEDPQGVMSARSADVVTNSKPVLAGDGVAPFFDRAQSRWVPARAAQALADGSRYAYVSWEYGTNVYTAHVTTVATGASIAFRLNVDGWSPRVVDFTAAGVYLMGQSAIGGPGERVWLLNPQTGAVKELGSVHQVWTVRDGYAWVARFDPRDKTKWAPIEIAPANSLVRIDLATGAESIWYYRAGIFPWLLGLDSSDRPVITVGADAYTNEIRLIDQPGSSGQLVFHGSTSGLDYFQGDHDRLWFGNYDGIYLYSPGKTLSRVFSWAGDPSNAERIEPAGFCQ